MWDIHNAPLPCVSDTALKWQHVTTAAASNINPHEYHIVNQGPATSQSISRWFAYRAY